MFQRSTISTSLKRKRKISLAKKIFAYFIFILFFISLFVLGLTTEQARIKIVSVSGNLSVPYSDIMKITDNEMGLHYMFIIPTNNILLLRKSEIKKRILNEIPKIGSVDILLRGIDRIEIAVVERESKYLWCKGSVAEQKGCYYMDPNGFVFQEAPQFSDNTFAKYFGLISKLDPIGQFYFRDSFRNISNLFEALKRMSFEPVYFNASDEHEYEVYLSGGGKILLNDEKSFESSLTNLQALMDNGYIKTDSDFLKKINYIDLRFGNKVNFQLNK